jgi:hypothetical protein
MSIDSQSDVNSGHPGWGRECTIQPGYICLLPYENHLTGVPNLAWMVNEV